MSDSGLVRAIPTSPVSATARRMAFVPFRELTRAEVNRDLQIHTVATDGQGTVSELIARAEALGLEEIAFTEHVRRNSRYFEGFADDVEQARLKSRVRVSVGIEVKTEDAQGTLDVSPEVLRRAEIVLGSVHRFPDGAGGFVSAESVSYAEAVEREMRLALGLLRRAPIDVLAHPGGMCQRAFGRFPQDGFEELMRVSLERRIAVEINTAYTRDLDGFLALCQRINPVVSVGSDVHEVSQLGACRDALWARGIGCA